MWVFHASLSRAGWWFRIRRPFSSGRMVGWKVLTLLLNWIPDHPCFPWLRLLDDGWVPQPVVLWRHQALQISHSRGFVVDRYNSCGKLCQATTASNKVNSSEKGKRLLSRHGLRNPNVITTLLSLKLNAKPIALKLAKIIKLLACFSPSFCQMWSFAKLNDLAKAKRRRTEKRCEALHVAVRKMSSFNTNSIRGKIPFWMTVKVVQTTTSSTAELVQVHVTGPASLLPFACETKIKADAAKNHHLIFSQSLFGRTS